MRPERGQGKKGFGLSLQLTALAVLALSSWAASCEAADRAKTIIDLQPFRQTSSRPVKTGSAGGLAVLTNLNPNINAWYLLQLSGISAAGTYHMENSRPEGQRLLPGEENPNGLVISQGRERTACGLWGADGLTEARRSGVPYAPLCGGKAWLRNPTRGHQTPLEAVTDFLREKVPGGREIVSFVRDTLFARIYRGKAEEKAPTKEVEGGENRTANGPASALLAPGQAERAVKPPELGIEVSGATLDGMIMGSWYAARGIPGVYVSVIVPGSISQRIMGSFPKTVNALDRVELGGLVYLVAFDLGQFDLHYSLGTEHPGVGWSGHIQSRMRDPSLPGPDGIGSSAPLVRTGMISPMDAPRTVATFTGGFKRYHGAFKYGPLAEKNRGSHYGFVEEGVIFSTLQPELATLCVLSDGRVEMKTWTEGDAVLLPRVRYARQNGVPIISGIDPSSQIAVPGRFVNRWGPGNWSGTSDMKLQSMRAGAALQEHQGRRFLVYAFFWSATPSAMARVFQAYQCDYAMLLDMNALVHTYLAVYRREGQNLLIQHLIKGMSDIDITVKGRYIPRFLGYADDRDFFYLTRKEAL